MEAKGRNPRTGEPLINTKGSARCESLIKVIKETVCKVRVDGVVQVKGTTDHALPQAYLGLP